MSIIFSFLMALTLFFSPSFSLAAKQKACKELTSKQYCSSKKRPDCLWVKASKGKNKKVAHCRKKPGKKKKS